MTDDTITFARKPLATLRAQGLDAMLAAHFEEVAHDKDVAPLAPDWERYAEMENAGGFIAYGMYRSEDLIGYTAWFANRSLHNAGQIFALNDVVYLKPAYRGVEGLRLILATEHMLSAFGITKIIYHTKADAFLSIGDDNDSLSVLDEVMMIEEEFGIVVPDAIHGGGTLGDVLEALGYRRAEVTYTKIISRRT